MIKTGIIGDSPKIKEFLEAIEEMPDLRISCFFAPSIEEAKRLIKTYSCQAKPTDTYEMMVDEIDAVYITIPARQRYETAKYFLQQQIHVIIESPMSLEYEQTIELAQIALRNNVVLLEVNLSLHSSMYARLYELIDKSQPSLANFNISNPVSELEGVRQGKFQGLFDENNGRGTVHNQLFNQILLSIFLFGKVKSVKSMGINLPNETSVLDLAIIQHENDVLVTLNAAATHKSLLVNQIITNEYIVGVEDLTNLQEIILFDKNGVNIIETIVPEDSKILNSFVNLLVVFVKMILGNKKDLLNYLLGMSCETARVLSLIEKNKKEIGEY